MIDYQNTMWVEIIIFSVVAIACAIALYNEYRKMKRRNAVEKTPAEEMAYLREHYPITEEHRNKYIESIKRQSPEHSDEYVEKFVDEFIEAQGGMSDAR